MIDLSNVIALTLGSTPVEQVTDSQGNVLWSGGFEVFIYAYHGNVSVNGVIGTFQQTVPSGTVLTVQGIPDSGYMFKNWSDGNTDNPRTITVQDNINLFSDFKVIPNYMYVENLNNADNILSITKNNDSAPTIEVFYSTDQQNWSSMGTTSTTAITATIPARGKLYLRCNTNAWGTTSYYNTINTNGGCNVGGNIMSLLYGSSFTGNETTFPSGSTYNFNGLFNNHTGLVDASNLLLPATTLTQGCYQNMFNHNNVLATTPALPARTLAQNCYASMFASCYALTTAPELSATTLTSNCYRQMFQYCSNLNSVTTYAQDISASDCLYRWLKNVAATGDFYNLGGATYPSGANGIPSGWTEHTSL